MVQTDSKNELSEQPLLTFQVITDTHIKADPEHVYNHNFEQALKDIAIHAPGSSGIMHAGDVTDHGFPGEYEEFIRIWNENKQGLPEMYFATGNHDVALGEWDSRLSAFLGATGMNAAYHDHWINGYHFIFLGTELGHELYCSLSDAQLEWLDLKLSEGASDSKPAFVILHQPLLNTVSGSIEGQQWNGVMQDAELKAVLSKHRHRAILFTGHTHWEMEAPHQYFDGGDDLPPMFNGASVAYLWTDEDEGREGSQGYYVEVYADRVVVRGRDFQRAAVDPAGSR